MEREMFSDLHRLFDEAIGAYREQLRKCPVPGQPSSVSKPMS